MFYGNIKGIKFSGQQTFQVGAWKSPLRVICLLTIFTQIDMTGFKPP